MYTCVIEMKTIYFIYFIYLFIRIYTFKTVAHVHAGTVHPIQHYNINNNHSVKCFINNQFFNKNIIVYMTIGTQIHDVDTELHCSLRKHKDSFEIQAVAPRAGSQTDQNNHGNIHINIETLSRL